jgi:hypothetical protein
MNIPQIDQDLATIKATDIQYQNGYTLTDTDLVAFGNAVNRLYRLSKQIHTAYGLKG